MKMNTQWQKISYRKVLADLVPRASGIYAVMNIRRAFGLPLESSPVYVGKSKNLRRRFAEHLSGKVEPNNGLRSLIGAPNMEFWFTRLSGVEMDEFEKTVIRGVQPSENIIKYNKG
jgi:excinuclease UvrABC nuclease subunit